MTSRDVVFGYPAVNGEWRCPDCGAPPQRPCYGTCDRYAEDPGPLPEPCYDDDQKGDGDADV